MKFEEQFPSLDKIGTHCDGCEGDDCRSIHRDDIQKHCLDKAKVKEAIDNATQRKYGRWVGTDLAIVDEVTERIKKELGL